MIRVVLVDDQELVRTGLRTLAEHDDDALLSPAVTGTVLATFTARTPRRLRPELLDGLTAREREVLAYESGLVSPGSDP